MVLYKCIRCNYSNIHKNDFKKHLKRKILCKPLVNDVDRLQLFQYYNFDVPDELVHNITQCNPKTSPNVTQCNPKTSPNVIPKKYICNYCNKGFAFYQGRSRHILYRCKKKDKHENIINQNINITNNTINSNNTINNTTNNIVLVAFGQEDMSKLSKEQILKCLKTGFQSVKNLTNAVHFNKQIPEFKNILVSNIKDKYGKIYDGAKWIVKNKNDLLNDLYDEKKRFIEEQLDNNDIISSLTNLQTNALNRWLTIEDEYDNDNDDKIKGLKSEILLELYNNRSLVVINI